MTNRKAQDRKEILAHINSIFSSFINRDRAAIQNAHTEDWIGFLVSSKSIERGIDAYMTNVDFSFENFRGVGFEILDSEVQIYDSIAIVYYVARYDYKSKSGETHSLPLRSVDIYRKEPSGWIQSGSHITIIPTDKV
ncbi:MAG: nuclear transport factor 2 family protein [candidate division Zixibacteria bacterium]|nr:nuclear transport factor 2 family protein [candidate division Zixibacteria bacterium]